MKRKISREEIKKGIKINLLEYLKKERCSTRGEKRKVMDSVIEKLEEDIKGKDEDYKFFTTHQICKLIGVTMPTIIRWIENGNLKSFKTVGGHRRVTKENLISFLNENNIPIPEGV